MDPTSNIPQELFSVYLTLMEKGVNVSLNLWVENGEHFFRLSNSAPRTKKEEITPKRGEILGFSPNHTSFSTQSKSPYPNAPLLFSSGQSSPLPKPPLSAISPKRSNKAQSSPLPKPPSPVSSPKRSNMTPEPKHQPLPIPSSEQDSHREDVSIPSCTSSHGSQPVIRQEQDSQAKEPPSTQQVTQKHQTTPLLTDTGYPTSGTFKSARFAFCFEDNCQLCFLCKETLYNSQPEFEKLCYSRQCLRNPHWHEETKRCTHRNLTS